MMGGGRPFIRGVSFQATPNAACDVHTYWSTFRTGGYCVQQAPPPAAAAAAQSVR